MVFFAFNTTLFVAIIGNTKGMVQELYCVTLTTQPMEKYEYMNLARTKFLNNLV